MWDRVKNDSRQVGTVESTSNARMRTDQEFKIRWEGIAKNEEESAGKYLEWTAAEEVWTREEGVGLSICCCG